MSSEYKNISTELYDLTKPPGTDIDGDLRFYKDLLMPLDGKVLEAGVGNGRLLIPFLKYGIDIEGIDNSIDMLIRCQKHLDEYGLTANLINDNLVNYKSNNRYEAIIMPNGSFCLLDEPKTVLTNFYASLVQNGFISLDLIYPISFKVGSVSEYSVDDIEVINTALQKDDDHQFTINKLEYRKGDLNEVQMFKLYWYEVEQFKQLLIEIGFRDIKVINNYGDVRKLNLKTITFIASK